VRETLLQLGVRSRFALPCAIGPAYPLSACNDFSLDFNPTRVCNPTTGRAGAFARSLDFNQRGRIPPHPKMAPELARRHPRGLLGFFRFPELGLREVIVAG